MENVAIRCLVDIQRQELVVVVDPVIPLCHLHIFLTRFLLLQVTKAASQAQLSSHSKGILS